MGIVYKPLDGLTKNYGSIVVRPSGTEFFDTVDFLDKHLGTTLVRYDDGIEVLQDDKEIAYISKSENAVIDSSGEVVASGAGGGTQEGFFVNGLDNIEPVFYNGSGDGHVQGLVELLSLTNCNGFSSNFAFLNNLTNEITVVHLGSASGKLITDVVGYTIVDGAWNDSFNYRKSEYINDYNSVGVTGYGNPFGNAGPVFFWIANTGITNLSNIVRIDTSQVQGSMLQIYPYTTSNDLSAEFDALKDPIFQAATSFDQRTKDISWYVKDADTLGFFTTISYDDTNGRIGYEVFHTTLTFNSGNSSWDHTTHVVHREFGNIYARQSGTATYAAQSDIALVSITVNDNGYNKDVICGINLTTNTPITSVLGADTTVGCDYDHEFINAVFDGVEYLCVTSTGWQGNNAFLYDVGWYSVFKLVAGQLEPVVVAARYKDLETHDVNFSYEGKIVPDYVNKKFITLSSFDAGTDDRAYEAIIDPFTGTNTTIISWDAKGTLARRMIAYRIYAAKPIMRAIAGVDRIFFLATDSGSVFDPLDESIGDTSYLPRIYSFKKSKKIGFNNSDNTTLLKKIVINGSLGLSAPLFGDIYNLQIRILGVATLIRDNIYISGQNSSHTISFIEDYYKFIPNHSLGVQTAVDVTFTGVDTKLGALTKSSGNYIYLHKDDGYWYAASPASGATAKNYIPIKSHFSYNNKFVKYNSVTSEYDLVVTALDALPYPDIFHSTNSAAFVIGSRFSSGISGTDGSLVYLSETGAPSLTLPPTVGSWIVVLGVLNQNYIILNPVTLGKVT